ncbi:MAG: prepilin-type N-terminal cleavage/methylation domain-containing protein [Mollicutes bacterium]|nr:prepilin-type N-terminal cleavage/methylation domain-containing protein [Mollicutes bacterium]
MKKKGFTLVELLAVIAILAILVIIALPNVLSMYNEARKNTFITEVRDYYKAGEQNFLLNSGNAVTYTSLSGVTGSKTIEMTGNKNMQYYIVFDANGKCTKLLATNGTYKVEATAAEINIEQLGDTYKADETSDKFTLVLDATDNSAKITGAVKSSN